MPLQNRVTPFGEIVADAARGAIMGNRGRFHRPDRTLGAARWASKAWIICVLRFKNRHRQVMQPRSYTELFFLDEATALAAGHRPCFECRRSDAERFIGLWRRTCPRDRLLRAGDLDTQLHGERLGPDRSQRRSRRKAEHLPDGAMVALDGKAWLKVDGRLAAWSIEGYRDARPLPAGKILDVLTPATTLDVLAAGYAPFVHATAAPHLDGANLRLLEGDVV